MSILIPSSQTLGPYQKTLEWIWGVSRLIHVRKGKTITVFFLTSGTKKIEPGGFRRGMCPSYLGATPLNLGENLKVQEPLSLAQKFAFGPDC